MSLLKSNVGKIDRIIRVIVGKCPLYSIIGINTKSLSEKAGLK